MRADDRTHVGLTWQTGVWDRIAPTYTHRVDPRFAPVIDHVVARAQLLTAQIFIDLERISGVDPIGQEIGTVAVIPGEVIDREIDEDEDRTPGPILRDHARGMVVEKDIGIGRAGAQRFGIEKMLDAGRGLKTPSADEGPEPGIKAVSAIAAFA